MPEGYCFFPASKLYANHWMMRKLKGWCIIADKPLAPGHCSSDAYS
jgi:hypothetical protein